MATLTVDKPRIFDEGYAFLSNEHPVIASDIIYAGAAVGESGSDGTARPLAAADNFLGFATEKADNSSGSAGDKRVKVRMAGVARLAVTNVTSEADTGLSVYASDDDTFTTTGAGNTLIGRIIRWVSSTTCMVHFQASTMAAPAAGEFSEIVGSDSALAITGKGSAAATTGGTVVIAGGVPASGNAAGGATSMTGGAGSGTGAGGASSVVGGASGSGATGTGGAVAVTGGASAATNGAGGAAAVTGGAGAGTGAGGVASLVGGASGAGATGNGANAAVTGGASGATNGSGGSVVLTPGAKVGTGIAGGVFLRSSTGHAFRQIAAPPADKGDTSYTLTIAEMLGGIVTGTPLQARTATTPTGAEISAGCPVALAVGDSFEFTLISQGTGADDITTLTAGASGVTLVGDATVGPKLAGTHSGSATWRFRNSAADTWIGYRIS
jgi:hypothetical protein